MQCLEGVVLEGGGDGGVRRREGGIVGRLGSSTELNGPNQWA